MLVEELDGSEQRRGEAGGHDHHEQLARLFDPSELEAPGGVRNRARGRAPRPAGEPLGDRRNLRRRISLHHGAGDHAPCLVHQLPPQPAALFALQMRGAFEDDVPEVCLGITRESQGYSPLRLPGRSQTQCHARRRPRNRKPESPEGVRAGGDGWLLSQPNDNPWKSLPARVLRVAPEHNSAAETDLEDLLTGTLDTS